MGLHFTFRKIKSTEALKEYITKKVDKFTKYVTYPMEVNVFLSIEKTYQVAEITVHAEHRQLVAVAKTKDLYESIDLAGSKIEKQLKKNREKRKGHKTAHLATRPRSLKLARDVNADLPHREKKMSSLD